jgi:hypothetical protein
VPTRAASLLILKHWKNIKGYIYYLIPLKNSSGVIPIAFKTSRKELIL